MSNDRLFADPDMESNMVAAFTMPGLEPVAEELMAAGITADLFHDTTCRRIMPFALELYANTGRSDIFAVKAAARDAGLAMAPHEWERFESISDTLDVDNAQGAVAFLHDLADRRRARFLTLEALNAIEQGSDHMAAWSSMTAAFEANMSAAEINWDLRPVHEYWDRDERDLFPAPVYGTRQDGARLLHLGAVTGLVGPPGKGKSLMAIALALEVMKAGGTVGYFDFESTADQVVARVRSHRDGEVAKERFLYRSVTKGMQPLDKAYLRRLYREDTTRPKLVVLDGINKMLGIHNVRDAHDATEVSRLIGSTVDLFRAEDVAVVTIDHTAKSSNGDPMGSRAKLALLDACLTIHSDDDSTAITKGKSGFSWIDVAKDRNGDIASAAMDNRRWGRFHVDSDARGRWSHLFTLAGGAM